jgi:glycosyltransferase involved in cell wall biosynthesis
MPKRRILQITSYPPPRAGWGVRVQFLKRHLEAAGHECVVLNVGRSRTIPSLEYETVMSGLDYLRKVWRFSSRGYVFHAHVNGDSPKGFVLTLLAELVNLLWGRRCFLTFHAGVDQIYFPLPKYRWLAPMYWVLFTIPRRIICNNVAVKEKIAEYGIAADKIVPIAAFSRQYLEFRPVRLAETTEGFYARFPAVVFTYIRVREGFYLDTMIEGFARLAASRPDVGLAVCGVSGDIDPALMSDMTGRIERHGLEPRVHFIDDLDHDEFLVALTRSALYLRTPTTDGVASSVLEALALGVPVVAAENGTRPAGVVTYKATDPDDLARVAERVLRHRAEVVRSIPRPEITDTLSHEALVLTA